MNREPVGREPAGREPAGRYERGRSMLAAMGGDLGAIVDPVADVAPDLARYAVEFAFGDVYSRPGLAPAQRQLLTVAVLTVMGGCEPQLRFHVGLGLDAGLPPETVVEAILHCLVFAGFPRVVNSIAVAKGVFAERNLLPLPTAESAGSSPC